MDSLDLLLSRRSISPAMLGDPGPSDADIETMVAAALRAPDHGGLRPWRYALVRGDARARLGDVFAEAVKARDPTWTEALLERERGRPLRSPLVVACGARIRPDHKIAEIEQLMAVSAATMNLLNAAHALGTARCVGERLRPGGRGASKLSAGPSVACLYGTSADLAAGAARQPGGWTGVAVRQAA
jgi:nitroreductase